MNHRGTENTEKTKTGKQLAMHARSRMGLQHSSYLLRISFSVLSVSLWFPFLSECRAELPHARLDRIFPLGGAAGSTVTLDLAGKDLDDVKTLHLDHPGFKAEFVKPNQFRVTIAADTPAGSY